ncbi:dnaJ homolog subfamily C member 4 isoform X2 [Erythrolamprus reginae]|uniref:dnaJ homolog subfamily C member 4 isoform X2 n=1 Tax=Erythrolamprus reginae TaxID=121349 RepID=UPI00396CA1EE
MALANLCSLCRCCQFCQNSRHRAFASTIYGWSSARHISHYDVLGIKQDATSKEIKQAFFRKSKQLHPDSNPTNPELHSQFVKLSEAYNVLSKEKTRRDYDAQQILRKAWQRQDAHRGSARDPFGDLHVHRQPRSQKTREHPSSRRRSSEDPFNPHRSQETGRNPDPFGADAYWEEFHKTPQEWYAEKEFKRRQQRNQRIVMYCLLIMSGSLVVHFLSYRARQEQRLGQKATPIPEEDPASKPRSGILDSLKDTVTPVSNAK